MSNFENDKNDKIIAASKCVVVILINSHISGHTLPSKRILDSFIQSLIHSLSPSLKYSCLFRAHQLYMSFRVLFNTEFAGENLQNVVEWI